MSSDIEMFVFSKTKCEHFMHDVSLITHNHLRQGPNESILKNSAFETRQVEIPESVGKPCDPRSFLLKKSFEGMPCEILILMMLWELDKAFG
jgi:hypothetical protein